MCASGDEKLDRGDPRLSPWTMLRTEGGERGLVSVYLSTILIWVITLQTELSWSALLAKQHNEVCRRSIKQCESRGIYLKNQREWLAWPSSWPVCWNQIREQGLAGKVVRPQGCSTLRISLLLAPTEDWFQTFLHVSGPSLILYMWRNSWRDRWVKGSIIYNPRSVYGEKICSYFSNPTVVLHGWWLLPHASLTWFKENKITSVLVWQCVRAGGSVRLRLALCAVRGEERWGGVRGGQGWGNNTAAIPVERNHLHNFMKAVFVRSDGSIKP